MSSRKDVLRTRNRERQRIKQAGGGRELASALLKRPTVMLNDKSEVTGIIQQKQNNNQKGETQ